MLKLVSITIFLLLTGCSVEPTAMLRESSKLNTGGDNKSEALKVNCDLKPIREMLTSKCADCHGGRNTLGGFSVSDAEHWDESNPDLIRAVSVMIGATMPPPGAPQLSDKEKHVLKLCVENSNAERASPGRKVDCENSSPISLAHIRRLSKNEYSNSLKAILGSDIHAGLSSLIDAVPESTIKRVTEFSAESGLPSAGDIEAYNNVATKAASLAVGSSAWLDANASCFNTTVNETCITNTLKHIHMLTFRRPSIAATLTEMRSIYNQGTNAKESLGLALRFALQNMRFLYLSSNDAKDNGDGRLKLSPYEVAERIAYLFTDAPPDQQLLTAAADSSIFQPEVVKAQINRLVNTSLGKATIKLFVREWLRLDSMPPLPNDVTFLAGINTTGLQNDMKEEVFDLFMHVLNNDLSFKDLFLSRHSRLTPNLASVYGVDSKDQTSPFIAELPAGQRAGILTRAALNIRPIYGSPFHAAKILEERILRCEEMVAPPANSLPAFNPGDPATLPNLTFRERFEKITLEPQCIGCHIYLNRVFAFGYDGLGRFATNEAVTDSTGQVIGHKSINREVFTYINGPLDTRKAKNPEALSDIIGNEERAKQCFSLQLWRSYAGRLESDNEYCAIKQAREKSVTLKETFENIFQGDLFFYVEKP